MLPEPLAITRCTACGSIFWVDEAPFLGELGWRTPYLVLTAIGVNRVLIMAVLRRHLGTDLAATKRLLLDLPLTIIRDVDERAVQQLHTELADAGAVVELIRSPPPMRSLDSHGYREALREGLARTREQEIFLRLRVWWCDNDPCRDGGAAWIPFRHRTAPVRENLERLYALLTQDASEGVSSRRLLSAEAARQLGGFEEALKILEHAVEEKHRHIAGAIAALARRSDDTLAEILPTDNATTDADSHGA